MRLWQRWCGWIERLGHSGRAWLFLAAAAMLLLTPFHTGLLRILEIAWAGLCILMAIASAIGAAMERKEKQKGGEIL